MSFLLKNFNSEARTVRAARSPAKNQYSIQRGGGGTTQRERKKTQQEEQQS